LKRGFEILVKSFGDLILALLCVAVIATLAGKVHWVLELLSHFQVYYFVGAVLLLIGNLILWRKVHVLITLGLVGFGGFQLYPYFLPAPEVKGAGKEYTVMQLNLNYANQKTAAVKEAIANAKPDLLILQEVTPRWRKDLDSLTGDFAHSFSLPEEAAFGIWILSQFEFQDIDIQRRDEIAFLHVKYKAGERPLEVVAMHPFPPVGGNGSRMRNEILEATAIYASDKPDVVGDETRIAVGDFNCSPWSPYFRDFLKTTGLRDSALGRGVKATWFPIPVFGIPIDHVLVSPDIEVLEREVGEDIGSDHRAVVVKFRFVPEEK